MGALLLLNHPDRVDKPSREDGSPNSCSHANLTPLPKNVRDAEQEAKLRYAFEPNSDQTGTEAREARSRRVRPENRIRLSTSKRGGDGLSGGILGVLLDQLPVSSHRVVDNGLERRAA